jgi:8-oxo-dGTP diphosphatase
VTVDAAVVSKPETTGEAPQLLLVQRKNPPCKGMWALPGGFVDQDEDLESAAARELQEETSVQPSDTTLFQVGAFGAPGRDPRGWTVTVAYSALVPSSKLGVKAADDAADAQWFPVGQLPPLAFDHKEVVRTVFERLTQRREVQTADGLVKALETGIQQLQGPWDPPKE